MNEKKLSLDDLDRKIILELQKNGRASFKTIAKKLMVSDGTVRFRVNRMIKKNLLRISALINPFYFENSITALIGMQLENRTQVETMKKISQLKNVLFVSNAAGHYDLFLEVFLESRKELNRFLFEELAKIEGIRSTETFVYLDALNKWIELKQ